MTNEATPHIYLATPSAREGGFHMEYLATVSEVQHECARRGWGYSGPALSIGAFIVDNRNTSVRMFLESEATHLLFVDSDIGVRGEDVGMMVQTGHPIVAAPCCKRDIAWDALARYAQSKPVGYFDDRAKWPRLRRAGNVYCIWFHEDQTEMVVENDSASVRGAGTGALLIRREALVKIRMMMGPDLAEDRLFDCGHGEWGEDRSWKEDRAFCERAQRAGVGVWAYIPAVTRHAGEYIHEGRFADCFPAFAEEEAA